MSKWKLSLTLDNVLTCAFYAAIGILLITLKSSSLGILMTIVGTLFIVMGILDALRDQNVTEGVIEAAIGVAVIVCGWLIAEVVLMLFGILLIAKGGIELYGHYKNGSAAIASAAVTIVIGILLVIAKWVLMDVFCIIAGVVFIIEAALSLFGKTLKS